MKKTKKMMALALAVSMVMGSSFAAFAEDPAPTTPGGSGSTTAEGSVEGHVDKEVLKVVLPTVPEGSSAFAYTMDPERLIQDTEHAKYDADVEFPAKENDTGVYFLTGPKKYENSSKEYQVINKSSCNVTLSIKAKTVENTANDITLATSKTLTSTAAELYLGLIVGKPGTSTATALSGSENTITKTIAGTPTNFKVGVINNADGTKSYTYQEKADATTWKSMKIKMEGAVSQKDITKDVTAPKVEVTWSWAKAADTATPDASDSEDYTVAPPAVAITTAGLVSVTGLTGERHFTGMSINGTAIASDVEWDLANYSDENGGDLNIQLGTPWMDWMNGQKVTVEVKLSDGSSITSSEVTLAK